MNIKSIIVSISNEQIVSDSFKKREFVVEHAENPQYPEYIKFECVQDKCDLLNDLTEGQEVDIYFNLKGRKWTNPKGEEVYFNTLQAWKIDSSVVPRDITPESEKAASDAFDQESDINDQLPF